MNQQTVVLAGGGGVGGESWGGAAERKDGLGAPSAPGWPLGVCHTAGESVLPSHFQAF